MKLLKCHIDNFGTLTNLDMDFESENGIKEVYEPNGWGKSTLTAFIKCMLYGFSAKTGKNIMENERLRYLPWNKGVCGGSITFEAGEKEYRVNRTFGKKPGEDTFELYNDETNLPSKDYSENLGEELFKIDRDSFIKTIYVDHFEVNSISSTGSINAKLGGISDVENDLKNLDAALEKCNDYLNKNSDTKKKGSLNALKIEINALKSRVSNKTSVDRAIEEHQEKEKEILSEIESFNKRHKEILEKSKKIADSKALVEKKRQYNSLFEQEVAEREKYNNSRLFFDGDIPSENVIDSFRENNEKLKSVLHQKKEAESRKSTLSAESEAEYKKSIDDYNSKISELEGKIKEDQIKLEKDIEARDAAYERYDNLKQDVVKTETEINSRKNGRDNLVSNEQSEKQRAEQASSRLSDAEKKYADLLRQREERQKQVAERAREESARKASINKKWSLILIASIIAVIVGIILFILNMPPVIPIALCIIGLVGTVLFIMRKASISKINYSEDVPDPYADIDANIKDAKDTVDSLREEFEELERNASAASKKINEFDVAGSDKENILGIKKENREKARLDYEALKKVAEETETGMSQKKEELTRLKSKKESDEESHRKKLEEAAESETKRLEDVNTFTNSAGELTATLLDNINHFLRDKFYVSKNEDAPSVFDSKINLIRSKTQEVAQFKLNADEAKNKLEKYAGENPEVTDTTVDDTIEPAEAVDEISFDDELDAISVSIQECQDRYQKVLSELDEIINERDEISESELLLSEKEEIFAEGKRRLNIVNMTKDYLEESRVKFISKHMSPVQTGFDKYYKMLTGEEQTLMRLNAHMELVLTVNSEERKLEALSAGYRDLIGLCYRMALADEMYKNEKPFIILDDPLSNLDDEKTKHGLEFISELAKDHQIIYLTCNKSRKSGGNDIHSSIIL